jgi:hypothetical protein
MLLLTVRRYAAGFKCDGTFQTINFNLVQINLCLMEPPVGRVYIRMEQPGRVSSLARIACCNSGRLRLASFPLPH